MTTEFLKAAEGGDIQKVQALLAQDNPKIDLNFQDDDGNTALILAAIAGHVEIVRAILTKDDNCLKHKNNAGNTAFLEAALNNQVKVMKCIREEFNFPKNTMNSLEDINIEFGTNALHMAAWKGHIAVAEVLLSLHNNMDITVRSNDQDTALMCAAAGGQVEMFDLLLSKNPAMLKDVNGGGLNSLHLAVRFGHPAMVEHLVREHKMRLDVKTTLPGKEATPLDLALHWAEQEETSERAAVLSLILKFSEGKECAEGREAKEEAERAAAARPSTSGSRKPAHSYSASAGSTQLTWSISSGNAAASPSGNAAAPAPATRPLNRPVMGTPILTEEEMIKAAIAASLASAGVDASSDAPAFAFSSLSLPLSDHNEYESLGVVGVAAGLPVSRTFGTSDLGVEVVTARRAIDLRRPSYMEDDEEFSREFRPGRHPLDAGEGRPVVPLLTVEEHVEIDPVVAAELAAMGLGYMIPAGYRPATTTACSSRATPSRGVASRGGSSSASASASASLASSSSSPAQSLLFLGPTASAPVLPNVQMPDDPAANAVVGTFRTIQLN